MGRTAAALRAWVWRNRLRRWRRHHLAGLAQRHLAAQGGQPARQQDPLRRVQRWRRCTFTDITHGRHVAPGPGPPERHRQPHTLGPGSARRSVWSPRTTTGSRRPLTRTSSTSSSNSRPDMIGNTARGRASPDDPACRVETTTTRVELRRTTSACRVGAMTRSSRASWTTPRCFLRGRSDRPSRATRQPRSGSSFARTTWLAGSTIPQSRYWLRPAGTRGEGGVEWSIHVSSLRIEGARRDPIGTATPIVSARPRRTAHTRGNESRLDERHACGGRCRTVPTRPFLLPAAILSE